jgi:hypothetical protein
MFIIVREIKYYWQEMPDAERRAPRQHSGLFEERREERKRCNYLAKLWEIPINGI